jgi:hypothetical protein
VIESEYAWLWTSPQMVAWWVVALAILQVPVLYVIARFALTVGEALDVSAELAAARKRFEEAKRRVGQ